MTIMFQLSVYLPQQGKCLPLPEVQEKEQLIFLSTVDQVLRIIVQFMQTEDWFFGLLLVNSDPILQTDLKQDLNIQHRS